MRLSIPKSASKLSPKLSSKLSPKVITPSLILKKHKTSVREITHIQNNYWDIPPKYSPLLSTYFILSWDIEYFRERLNQGIIRRDRTDYQVIYHRTNPAEIAKGKGQVKLSFRAYDKDLMVYPVVLVSLSHKFHNATCNHSTL